MNLEHVAKTNHTKCQIRASLISFSFYHQLIFCKKKITEASFRFYTSNAFDDAHSSSSIRAHIGSCILHLLINFLSLSLYINRSLNLKSTETHLPKGSETHRDLVIWIGKIRRCFFSRF